ncbi:MAG: hypothetical protein HY719_08980, partial [Planctomycetes bacterium]|nr:hypothetical protein [Planctomycetota bacterium]
AQFLQVHNAFIVYETEEGVAIVDQHALHERVRYHQIGERVKRSPLERQRLLVPVMLHPSPEAAALLRDGERLAELKALGFEIGEFGEGAFAVFTTPLLGRDVDAADFVEEFAQRVAAGGRSAKGPGHLEAAIEMMACRSAVRAGDPLSPEAMAALVEEAGRVETRYACAHGRPTTLTLSVRQLERFFDRH